MSPLVQSKVLRVLQEQKFERVGGSQTIQTDVRIITATNRDLKKMVAGGDFREDLYYRLNGFTIEVTPLRDRGDDLLLLLQLAWNDSSRAGRRAAFRDTSIVDALPWPGNVRAGAMVQQSLQTR
jgi:two-component system nitrogen regulation response regulator GlnG